MHLRNRVLGASAMIVASVKSEADRTLSLTPDVAFKLARAAHQLFNEQGYQVAVAVVDHS